MDKKKKVLVGMSGGVDSAVSAYLLLQQGYEVVAGFMKNYADESNPNCHTREDRDMAIKVAQHLGIKTFVIFDFREEYDQKIIQYIYDGYLAGLTPNPDVLCNSEIKFKLFLEKAMELGCDFVATGHYAQLEKTGEMVKLLRGVDETKDQSYFLAGLNQYQLNHSLFPIGGMLKSEVRALATEIGLPNADRKDSQGLCFIGKVPMVDFLKKALPVKQGEIVDQTGKKLGYHDGAWFYTIGQRHGIKLHQQYYVVSTDVKKNIVVVDT
ncbi:MAG TPA: tRNA 2-thiouridine(34) synthase MnmA, partial [Candidatus Absconditabacterales bacterium]|nr:tRNA 2-thiouridine(34) synthase MnmA [Candidatus Absconditabacterales bacterium]